VSPEDGDPSQLQPWLQWLKDHGLYQEVQQLLDALWLSMAMPDAGVPDSRRSEPHADQPPEQPSLQPRSDSPVVSDARQVDAPARKNEVEVVLREKERQGIYPWAGPAQDGDPLRARPIRVAGATALREAPAMARALRPMGRRRRSLTRFVFDEASSVERYAESGVLVPQWQPERERFFSATLLVEETPALPLWRSLVRELETLLARQGGFRRFRRMTLADVKGDLCLRSRNGALYAPRTLLDEDAALVLIASDGTTPVWADGRMAAMLHELGSRSPLALLQWLPERLWPNTAVGGAPLRTVRPRPAAANAEMLVTKPRWLRGNEPFVAAPMASLTPASFARLADSLMGRPGVQMPAALLWCQPQPTERSSAPPETLDAQARIARFRSVASARALQTAVQLSAVAPLTLPVIKLVHRVMQPDAPTSELPMLLLGGLLERCPSPTNAAEANRANDAEDDQVLFDFAPGVRRALQTSLLKSDADAVRMAVSRYIAERTGNATDFTALLLDPRGPLNLPAWAQPFAELSRQVQQLFEAPTTPLVSDDVVRETALASGVTIQADHRLNAPVRQLAWSPSGDRLAVLEGSGLRLLRSKPAPGGPRSFDESQVSLSGTPTVLIVKGTGLIETVTETLLSALKARLTTAFRDPWQFRYHTAYTDSGRFNPSEVHRVVQVIAKQRMLTIFIGNAAFEESSWMHAAETSIGQLIDLSQHPAIMTCTQMAPAEGPMEAQRWNMRTLGNTAVQELHETAAGVGFAVADALWKAGSRAVPEVAFGPDAVAMSWNHEGDLLIADTGRNRIMRERDLHQYLRIPPEVRAGEPMALAANPHTRDVILLGRGRVLRMASGEPKSSQRLDGGTGTVDVAWSPDGQDCAWRHGSRIGQLGVAESSWSATEPHWFQEELGTPVTAGPAWRSGHRECVFGLENGTVSRWVATNQGWEKGQWLQSHHRPVQGVAWSPEGGLLAVVWADGHLSIGRPDDQAWTSMIKLERPGAEGDQAPICITFMPRGSDSPARFETLAVGWGEELRLLRIDLSKLSLKRRTRTTAVNDAVRAASAALRALAMEFRLGRFAPPGKGSVLARYAALLGTGTDDAERYSTLTHLWRRADSVFDHDVDPVLEGGPDPLLPSDHPRGRELVKRVISALDTLDLQSDGTRVSEVLARSLLCCEQLVDGLSSAEVHAVQALTGVPIAALLKQFNPTRGLTATDLEQARFALNEVGDSLAPLFARAAWLRVEDGPSQLLRSRTVAEYVDRYVARLADIIEDVVAASTSSPQKIRIRIPRQLPAVEQIIRLGASAGLGVSRLKAGDNPEEFAWEINRASAGQWFRLLGAIVVSALARMTHVPSLQQSAAPCLRLLWVDDRPNNNVSERKSLAWRGFLVETAVDTDSALIMLESNRGYDAVISDMGRPPDARAGYTLLRAMRARGDHRPFFIYSAGQNDATRAEARNAGASVSTSRFNELEDSLLSVLLPIDEGRP